MDSTGIFDARNNAFFAKALARTARRGFAGGGSAAGGVSRARGGFGAAVRRTLALAGAVQFQKRQATIRAAAAREGRQVPGILIASVTRKCNLDCSGCYSKALRPD